MSDEFKQVISTLKGHDDKVRVVLNKADQVDMQQLMRVYGALMWSLGKVFRSPEARPSPRRNSYHGATDHLSSAACAPLSSGVLLTRGCHSFSYDSHVDPRKICVRQRRGTTALALATSLPATP